MLFEIQGDLIETALTGGLDVLVHQVNGQGRMNKGLAKDVRRNWPDHYHDYLNHCDACTNLGKSLLGTYISTYVGYHGVRELWVTGLFGQQFYGRYNGVDDYGKVCSMEDGHTNFKAVAEALDSFLSDSLTMFREKDLILIGFPSKMGCGLGSGNEEQLRDLLLEKHDWINQQTSKTVNFYLFDL
jgi:hypothetical protein